MGLDWEEGVFCGLLRMARLIRRSPTPEDPTAVHLVDLQSRLTVVARVIAGTPVRLRVAERWGRVQDGTLRLPARITVGRDITANTALYLVRTSVDAAIIRLNLDREQTGMPENRLLASLRAARKAAEWLSREFPSFAALHAEGCARELAQRIVAAPLTAGERAIRSALAGGCPWDDPEFSRPGASLGCESLDLAIWGELLPAEYASGSVTSSGAEQAATGAATEAEAPAKDQVNHIEIEPSEDGTPPPQAPYERVETADSYKGGSRDCDGDDDLQDHLEALRDCDLREVVRGGERAQSIYRLDLRVDGSGGEVADEPGVVGIPYDEWDHKRKMYRRGWCTVVPARAMAGDARWAREAIIRHRSQIMRLRRLIERHRTGLAALGRQLDGEEIDVPAVIDEQVARWAGHGGDQRLYTRLARRRRDIAVTVLIDISLSTDAHVQGLRVLDVAREAVLVLGEATEALGDRIQVLAFSTNTRTRCKVWEIRGWDETWQTGCARLGALEPCGYTRIGPPLRHATAGLCRIPAERRLLLLISDGKATDYDRYEGRYGDADVRQALIEARRRGIHCHALAIDHCAREHLPSMFGVGHWHLMTRPADLPEALATVYARLTAA